MDMILRDMNNEGKKTWEVYTSKQVRSSEKTEQNIDQSLGWLKDNFEETALPGESTQMNLTSSPLRYVLGMFYCVHMDHNFEDI